MNFVCYTIDFNFVSKILRLAESKEFSKFQKIPPTSVLLLRASSISVMRL